MSNGQSVVDTAVASRLLKVSRRRVLALIGSQHLRAQRLGGGWAIAAADVAVVKDMLRTKKGRGGHPIRPLRSFGQDYALGVYGQGTFLRWDGESYWFAALDAKESLERLHSLRDRPVESLVRHILGNARIAREDAAALLTYALAIPWLNRLG